MHRFLTIFSFVALAFVATQALAQEHSAEAPHGPKWVQQKIQVCQTCHGKNGVSTTPMFPIIAGQYESYLYHALTSYQNGQRKSAIMSGQVANLTDDQLKALAEYFSRQKTPLYTPGLDNYPGMPGL